VISSGAAIVSAAVIASSAFVAFDHFERVIAQPVAAQVWVEEGAAVRADNAQAIAEVLIRRSLRASKVKGRKVTIQALQSGKELDAYTGPISAWEGFGTALAAGRKAWATDPTFRAETTAAALRAWLAVRAGIGPQVAEGALWWRHVSGTPPAEWRGQPLAAVLPAPLGKSLAIYRPAL
jgi:hypothetical protein